MGTGEESVAKRRAAHGANDIAGKSSVVEVHLLGHCRVARNGEDVALPASRKARALLAYLLMAPRPVHRARLCELFWAVPNDPRGELRWCLSKIRGVLDEPFQRRVKAENDWVAIDASNLQVDALSVAKRAERTIADGDLQGLKELATKLEGEFLEGFEADRIPLFEAWLIGERHRFREFHAHVLSRIVSLLPRTSAAIPYIRKRLDLLPFDEAAHLDLMVTLAACGRFAEGEAHLEAASRLFSSEGLSRAPLERAWREHRLLAGRSTPADSSPLTDATSEKSGPPRLSIVVLPFANMGPDPEQEYFVDGVTDSLTTDLSRMRGMLVIGRNTAFTFKGKAVDLKQMGRDLNVRYVLEGSVQRGGDRMRVNVQLVDAETGNHLWAERFDKPLADLFDMQDEIVARLANAVNAQLVAAEARRAERAPNPDSTDLYFQGLARLHKGLTRERLLQAHGFFERALALDPGNLDALVRTALIGATSVGLFFPVDDRRERLKAAEATIAKALSLAPEDAFAHYALGVVQVLTNRSANGVAEFETALLLDPNLALAHGMIGLAKTYMGRAGDAEGHVRQALRLSPLDTRADDWCRFVALAKLCTGADQDAAAWSRRSVETNRNAPVNHFILAAALAHLDRTEEARAAARAGLALDPNFSISHARATVFSDNPTFLAQRERVLEGFRKAGIPEG